ncbi:MAG: SGNH/GDSL hydrolase family protein [Candidatus Hydrogenedentes bacterium]|nr:SGNH/GDSL hydrolase family protein [Candidatus Hydrogenedentota bacterium]
MPGLQPLGAFDPGLRRRSSLPPYSGACHFALKWRAPVCLWVMPTDQEPKSGDLVSAAPDSVTAPKPRWGFGTRILLLSLPTLVTLAIGLCSAEWFTRDRALEIMGSDALDPGLTVHDETLGWRLAPLWSGHHLHYDYSATYHTSRLGFRNDSPDLTVVRHPWYAVLGDSFVFGFGVNDDQTFVHILNEPETPARSYVNFGVPGYSTDQQLLLLERQVLDFKPDGVLFFVYLGNDLFDNMRLYPMQARRAKPYFALSGSELDLRNTPVPQAPSPTPDARLELRKTVLGESSPTAIDQVVARSVLLAGVWERYSGMDLSTSDMRSRFTPAIELFKRIADRAQHVAVQRGASFTVVVLAGRSFVETPRSMSATYQQYLREEILAWADKSHVGVVDLAGELREAYADRKESWYYRNDGHLNPEGHAKVASILADKLDQTTERLSMPPPSAR